MDEGKAPKLIDSITGHTANDPIKDEFKTIRGDYFKKNVTMIFFSFCEIRVGR